LDLFGDQCFHIYNWGQGLLQRTVSLTKGDFVSPAAFLAAACRIPPERGGFNLKIPNAGFEAYLQIPGKWREAFDTENCLHFRFRKFRPFFQRNVTGFEGVWKGVLALGNKRDNDLILLAKPRSYSGLHPVSTIIPFHFHCCKHFSPHIYKPPNPKNCVYEFPPHRFAI